MINSLESKKNSLQILIVEDHPLTCLGYALILEQASLKAKIPQLKVQQANSLKKAYHLLIIENIVFDMVFLDICMPPYIEKNLFSGEDLGKLLIKKHSQTRILIMSSLTDKFRLEGILQRVKPQGFLVKSEVNENHLVMAIQQILINQSYYSTSIAKILQEVSMQILGWMKKILSFCISCQKEFATRK